MGTRVPSFSPLRLVTAALVLASSTLQAQPRDAAMPSPAAVFARTDAAVGLWDGHRSILMKGAVTDARGMTGLRFERYVDRDGNYFSTVVNGATAVSRESLGASGAERETAGASSALSASTVQSIRDHAIGGWHAVATRAEATVVGFSDFMGCDCVKVREPLAAGDIRLEYYDLRSGLLTGVVREGVVSRRKTLESMTLLKDYHVFDSAWLPTTIPEQEGKEWVRYKVESVRWDAPPPAALAARVHR